MADCYLKPFAVLKQLGMKTPRLQQIGQMYIIDFLTIQLTKSSILDRCLIERIFHQQTDHKLSRIVRINKERLMNKILFFENEV